MVARHPDDLAALYDQGYYQSAAPDPPSGYENYESVSAQSVGWAAALVPLLRSGGKVLDVGCADGSLLASLPAEFERFGIEVNPKMAEAARSRGVKLLGRTLEDPEIARYSGTFDVVTVIATLEHLADLGAGLRVLRSLVRPDGLVFFEVPSLSEGADSVWLRSSLEHVYYPSPESMRNAFGRNFGSEPVVAEFMAEDYGSLLVGIATPDPQRHEELLSEFERLFHGKISSLRPAEQRFRILFDLVHLAHRDPEVLESLSRTLTANTDPAILRRLTELWLVDVKARAEVTRHRGEVEGARDFFREQASRWEAETRAALDQVAELRSWVAQVERARDHHAQQSREWQRAAERTRDLLREVSAVSDEHE
jgi:2-polyprenyl-3-methyl-5-hydroxy-6-metoxy-1,4-benzoquinol methylase